MLVPELLLQTLEELPHEDFQKFQWYLSTHVLDGCKPIGRSRLENASRTETVSKVISSYGEESALEISTAILRKIGFNSEAEALRGACSDGKTAATSTSSAAAAPAPASMTAQQGSVIIAPRVIGGTSGSWNITVNKS